MYNVVLCKKVFYSTEHIQLNKEPMHKRAALQFARLEAKKRGFKFNSFSMPNWYTILEIKIYPNENI